ncbi:MAG: GNAT family N-acetyltransferase [Alphaproteobacteria bacterium]
MTDIRERAITFARLPEISRDEIIEHMSDPRIAGHMPLLTSAWDSDVVMKFIAAKEACWRRDGLGHWAILCNGRYIGWGGFQREGDEWDFGLVLKPDSFGLGPAITSKAIEFARGDDRIPLVTFLLPPSRKRLAALQRFGARFVGEVVYDGAKFRKYRLDTERLEDQRRPARSEPERGGLRDAPRRSRQ